MTHVLVIENKFGFVGSNVRKVARKKLRKCSGFYKDQLLPKPQSGHILRDLTCPLLEVRQAEIEAGDCEGRLPLLFLGLVRCQWSVVSCQE